MNLLWPFFFRQQRAPVLRSQMLTALLAGTQIAADRLPVASLPDAVLIAAAARRYCDAEVVDNWDSLRRRTEEKWAEPEFTHRVFDQTLLCTVGFLTRFDSATALETPEACWVPGMVEWYLRHEVPQYFRKEL